MNFTQTLSHREYPFVWASHTQLVVLYKQDLLEWLYSVFIVCGFYMIIQEKSKWIQLEITVNESQMDGVLELVNSGTVVKSIELWSEIAGSLASAVH